MTHHEAVLIRTMQLQGKDVPQWQLLEAIEVIKATKTDPAPLPRNKRGPQRNPRQSKCIVVQERPIEVIDFYQEATS